MKYILSVIVPIYNSELYLEESINSLVNQTIFKQIEIILINDGSTDSSLNICQDFKKKYNNIKVINQKNQGVSAARNTGLKNVNGKYVTFFDSDDIIDPDLYEKELTEVEANDCDLLIVDFDKIHEDGQKKKYRKNYLKKWTDTTDALIAFFSGEIDGQVVNKLFLYKNIKMLSFSSEYKIGEDMLFTYQALKKSKNIFINTNICGYHYIVRDSSAMTGVFSTKYFDPIEISYNMFQDSIENERIKKYSESHMIHELVKVIEYIYRHNAQAEYSKKVEELTDNIRKYSIIDAYRCLVRKQFYGFLLMRLSPKCYLLVHKILHIG